MQLELGDARFEVEVEGAAFGLIVASGLRPGPAPAALSETIRAAVAAGAPPELEARRGPVRDLLRFGRYKPTGRGKPACEYLARAASEGSFPAISTAVDALNLVSLQTGLPISIFDVALAGSRRLRIRRGRAGEAYVFNAAGQSIELQDLLLVAAGDDDRPIANPVKDSLATKLTDASTEVVAVVYAPASLAELAHTATAELAALLERHAEPARLHTAVVV